VILVDTSAWVEFDRATNGAEDRRLRRLISSDGDIAVTEPVVMEVLVGARSPAHEADLRRLLRRFHHLPFDAAVDFEAAVSIYQRCRRQGVTPRGLIDCMIAAVAFRYGSSLLTADVDLVRVGRVVGLEVVR
jgi:predicted nucleic acid-binding protein